MKKIISILLTVALAASMLAGCGSNDVNYKGLDFVTLGDYKNLAVTVEKAEVTEEDITAYIEDVIEAYPPYKTLDKTVVEKDDLVCIDYEGFHKGVAFQGGTAKKQYLKIGSKTYIDGFEDGLIGGKVGETVELNLTFPDKYPNNPALEGEKVVFKVKINGIVEKAEKATYKDLTDEYVAAYLSDIAKTVDELKKSAKSYMENYHAYTAESEASDKLVDLVIKNAKIDGVPKKTLKKRVENYLAQYEVMCQSYYGVTLEALVKNYYGMTMEEFEKGAYEFMQESLEEELVMMAIAETENIQIDEKDYAEFMESLLASYGYTDEKTLYKDYGENFIKNTYLCSKALELIVESADITYTVKSTEKK